MCVSEGKKQSKVVNRCAYKGDREGVHMGDIVVQQNVRVFLRQGVRRADRRGQSARDDKGTERRRGEMEG